MSANRRESAAPASATTQSETTPASALRTTCRSTVVTTAWVSLFAPQDEQNAFPLWFTRSRSLLSPHARSKIWERATATGTFTQTTGHVMESWPLTWRKRCAAAPITLAVLGINHVNNALFPALVSSDASIYSCTIKTALFNKSSVPSAEFGILCGSERPGYYIDITTGRVIGKILQF